MPAMSHCRACGKAFTPDFRNPTRQAFCTVPTCQRARRTQAQRQRRQRPGKQDALTRRLKPSEAAWLKKHPLMIGLISVLIGSTKLEDIAAFCSAASERGARILNGELLDESPNWAKDKGFDGKAAQ